MATIFKCLYSISNLTTGTHTPVYGPPSGKSAAVTRIILTNKTGTGTTVGMGIRKSDNSSWRLGAVSVGANSRVAVTDQVTLSYVNSTGERLELWAGAGSTIDAVLNGFERDTE